MQETWVWPLGWEDPLEKGYSSILAWRIPQTLESTGSQRVRHVWVIIATIHWVSLVSQREQLSRSVHFDSWTNISGCCAVLFCVAWGPTSLLETPTAGCPSCFASMSSFFLKRFLLCPSSILDTYRLRAGVGSSFSFIFCLLLILLMGFSKQECWSCLPFPSPVDHILSELFTVTHPLWVALNDMAHSFIELHKAMIHVIILL